MGLDRELLAQRPQIVVADHLRDALSITELCALYGVSRKTYNWSSYAARAWCPGNVGAVACAIPGKPTSQGLAPNGVWSGDYKGQFRIGDGQYCYPLTVADGCSLYLLGCQALTSTAGNEAKPIFTRLYGRHHARLAARDKVRA
jgi:hypothetical protein